MCVRPHLREEVSGMGGALKKKSKKGRHLPQCYRAGRCRPRSDGARGTGALVCACVREVSGVGAFAAP